MRYVRHVRGGAIGGGASSVEREVRFGRETGRVKFLPRVSRAPTSAQRALRPLAGTTLDPIVDAERREIERWLESTPVSEFDVDNWVMAFPEIFLTSP